MSSGSDACQDDCLLACRVSPGGSAGRCGGVGVDRSALHGAGVLVLGGEVIARQCACGLSPRVRRHPRWSSPTQRKPRSISACAEAPLRPDRWASSSRVYLRVCGGTGRPAGASPPIHGLSPRVRRHRPRTTPTPFSQGSISACAEAPRSPRSSPPLPTVYLRVCGGTPATTCQEQGATGLSLRVLLQRATVCRRACSPHILRGSVEKCNPQRRARQCDAPDSGFSGVGPPFPPKEDGQ